MDFRAKNIITLHGGSYEELANVLLTIFSTIITSIPIVTFNFSCMLTTVLHSSLLLVEGKLI